MVVVGADDHDLVWSLPSGDQREEVRAAPPRLHEGLAVGIVAEAGGIQALAEEAEARPEIVLDAGGGRGVVVAACEVVGSEPLGDADEPARRRGARLLDSVGGQRSRGRSAREKREGGGAGQGGESARADQGGGVSAHLAIL